MENRITEKQVELKGRKFIIHKFDPLFGSYISLKVLNSSNGKGLDIKNFIDFIIGNDQNEFNKIQKEVLKYCSEMLPSGKVPVINEEGNLAVVDLTTPMIISLFFQTIMFSLQDFFEEEVSIPNL